MPSRDSERIEEEIAGVERPEREHGLSGEYLLQAVEALHDAGDPAYLFAHWRRFPPKDSAAVQTQMHDAGQRARVRAGRNAVLFAAFAAESYVNEFLHAHGVLDPWDRKPTLRKFLKGTEEAFGSPLFFADREAYPVIVDLFKLRDRLVHPKPGFGAAGGLATPNDEFVRLFALPKLAEFIVMVGGSADLLVPRAFGYDSVDAVGIVAWRGREVIRGYAKRNQRMPAWDADSERPLFRQAGDHVMAMNARLPELPELSLSRLRSARGRRLG